MAKQGQSPQDDLDKAIAKALEREGPKANYIVLTGGDRICTRCGAMVHRAARKFHTRWHAEWEGPLPK